jgi:hypothetical protein
MTFPPIVKVLQEHLSDNACGIYFNGPARVLEFVTLSLENPCVQKYIKSLDFFLCLLHNQSAPSPSPQNFSSINNDHLSSRGTLKIIDTHYALTPSTAHFTKLLNITVRVDYSPPSYHASHNRSRR